nr:hypothetical protein GCM10020185_73110 [Pseudomonas brassicacearum subsp. brassicacearum]
MLALRDQIVPPTLNLVHPDEAAAGLDLVGLKARKMPITHALSNGFGFGGVNASVLFRRWGGLRFRGRVYIRCCGNGYLGFRLDGGSLLEEPGAGPAKSKQKNALPHHSVPRLGSACPHSGIAIVVNGAPEINVHPEAA